MRRSGIASENGKCSGGLNELVHPEEGWPCMDHAELIWGRENIIKIIVTTSDVGGTWGLALRLFHCRLYAVQRKNLKYRAVQ